LKRAAYELPFFITPTPEQSLSMKSLFGNAYVLLTLATFLWGGNSVAGKLASYDWQPFTITSARWLLTSILLLPFAWKYV